MRIVLASASPRRTELIKLLNLPEVAVIPAEGEERAPADAPPGEIVEALASAKSAEVAAKCGGDDVIIAADTIVWHRGKKLGKPKSEAEAADMLRALSGEDHLVYTGLSVRRGLRELTGHEVTKVRFRPLSEGEISAYVATGEPMDKAGAYGAQGRGAVFVRGVEGDFFNVIGLPLCRLSSMLKTIGVDVL